MLVSVYSCAQIFVAIGTLLSTCCTVAKSPEMLMIGRVMFGVLIGMTNAVTPMFLAEIAAAKIRGALCTIHLLTYNIGCLVSSVLGLPQILSNASTWFLLHLVIIGPILVVIMCFPLIPESPRYLFLVSPLRWKLR